jgi:hypothetical protein
VLNLIVNRPSREPNKPTLRFSGNDTLVAPFARQSFVYDIGSRRTAHGLVFYSNWFSKSGVGSQDYNASNYQNYQRRRRVAHHHECHTRKRQARE